MNVDKMYRHSVTAVAEAIKELETQGIFKQNNSVNISVDWVEIQDYFDGGIHTIHAPSLTVSIDTTGF